MTHVPKMPLPLRYRLEAARCRALANSVSETGKRENFISLAEQFEVLADDAEISKRSLH